MRLLVTGAAGMLGHRVVDVAKQAGHDVVGIDIDEADITDAESIGGVVADIGPDAIIHCAAFTNVDGAEENEDLAAAINAAGAGNVARAAAATGARIVHLSTDYVFDGEKDSPWVESDPVAPLGAYGRTKLAGELEVQAATPDHAIARTAWLFGAGGPNFCDTMLRLASERDSVSVVTDQIGCPTWTGHLAPGADRARRAPRDRGLPHRRRRPVLLVRTDPGAVPRRRRQLPGGAHHSRAVRPACSAPDLERDGVRARMVPAAAAMAGGSRRASL